MTYNCSVAHIEISCPNKMNFSMKVVTVVMIAMAGSVSAFVLPPPAWVAAVGVRFSSASRAPLSSSPMPSRTDTPEKGRRTLLKMVPPSASEFFRYGPKRFKFGVFKHLTRDNPVVLFMNGEDISTACYLSSLAIQALDACGVEYIVQDVLDWPDAQVVLDEYQPDCGTLPQLYVSMQFVGDGDYIVASYQSGELLQLLLNNKICGLNFPSTFGDPHVSSAPSTMDMADEAFRALVKAGDKCSPEVVESLERSPAGSRHRLKNLKKDNYSMLFTNDSDTSTKCLSSLAIQAIEECGRGWALDSTYDVSADPCLRQAIQDDSCCSTFPQLYASKGFVGDGGHIVALHRSGRLSRIL